MKRWDPQTEWARMIMRAFADCGVRDVVLSPGSRSTPFVLATSADDRLRIHTIIDERAAAFFALGQARASGAPSLLLCTSGSAPAHYLPAIVEAELAHIPMLVLSADRGPEAQRSGAPQTIDQTRLFGDHVEAFFELGAVDPHPAALRATRRLVAQAVSLALGPTRGAVQVNVRARKPLEPGEPRNAVEEQDSERIFALSQSPMTLLAAPGLRAADVAALATRLAAEPHGVVALGPAPIGLAEEAFATAVSGLAEQLGYPILTQPTSPAAGPSALSGAISVLLASPRARAALRPGFVLQIGGAPVATPYEALLAESPAPHLEIVSAWPEIDADSQAYAVHVGDLQTTIEALGAALRALGVDRRGSQWSKRWKHGADIAARAVTAHIANDPAHELASIVEVARALDGTRTKLIVGNSLPVRELSQAAALASLPLLRSLHQRGASGIDGMCAGAAGVAAVSGATALLIGDVTLLHDLHGLLLAGQTQAPLVVIVVVNGGGRIFDQLPVLAREDLRKEHALFNTPIAADWSALAKFCGAHHAHTEASGPVGRSDRSCARPPSLDAARSPRHGGQRGHAGAQPAGDRRPGARRR